MKDISETLLRRRDCLLPQRLRLQSVSSAKEALLRLHVVVLVVVGLVAGAVTNMSPASGDASGDAAPIFGVKIPEGYRDWRLISVAHEEGKLNDIRAILGNDLAIKAAREGKLPYPDGTIIARLAWSYDPLAESSEAFGRPQSYVAGASKNGVQFMVKDSRKYASSGGWGFAQFDQGKPASEAVHNTCFSCHAAVKARDFVFNRYAP
ncbi:MAG TPA: cytochrome P460 family protein [Aestuariivirgaceae bacterium]|nr:cytochrome P460 family protein [Aestuariivirgaceae bacterium]